MQIIFKREPALWLGLTSSAVAVIGAFLINLSSEQEGVVNAVIFALLGVITAVIVHDGIGAAVLGFFKALIALVVAFGLHMDAPHQALLMTFIAAIVAMFVRTQVTAPVPPQE